MPFQTAALDSTKLEKLRGTALVNPTYRGAKYMSLCPNTTVFAARVNGAPSGSSYAQVTFDTVTTGAYTDVLVDMRVLISHTSDRRAAFFDGRARLSATSTILYINETSAAITDDDYIFVIDDYPLIDKLAAIRGVTQFKDYAVSWRYMLPFVRGLQTAYCGWIATPSDVSTKFRVAFSITATAAQSGASISSYLWTFPASKTIISGSTTAAAVTVDFASSAGDWCHLKVTDSNGNYITRHFFVHAASDTYPPSLGFTGMQISGAVDSGWSASCEAFTGVSSVLDNTFAVGWDVEYYNGTEGALLGGGAAVKFVGRFRQENIETRSDDQYSQVQAVRYSLEGPAAQLARLESLPRALLPDASPNDWDEIKDLTLWRAIVHILAEHSTFLNLHDISFDDVGTTYLTAQLGITGGDIYRAVQDIAVSINAVFEFAPQGESRVIREANYQTSAERNALPTVADFTSADWIDFTIDTDPVTKVGKVPASGGTYDSARAYVTPLLALAPGLAQESGTDEPALTRQILTANATPATAQSELNTRAGHHYAKNNDQIVLNVVHPDGYNFLVPSVGQWYTWTIAATDNLRGLAYTTATRWLLVAVSIEDDNERGTKGGGVNATYVIETSGAAGATIEYPSTSEITPYLPDIPFDPYAFAFPEDPGLYLGDSPLDVDVPPDLDPDAGATVPKDGSAVLAWDESAPDLIITRNFLRSANPVWKNIQPTTSAVDSPGSGVLEFDFTLPANDGGFEVTAAPGSLALYSSGVGWVTVENGGGQPILAIHRTFVSTTITNVHIEYETGANATGGTRYVVLNLSGANVDSALLNTGTGSFSEDFPFNDTVDEIIIELDTNLISPPGNTVTRVAITWVGDDPAGATSFTHINHACFDPFPGFGGKVAAYVLADNSTDSFVFRTEDAFANPVEWSQGAVVSGLYKLLRLGNTAGQIQIGAPDIGGSSKVAVSSNYGATFSTAVTVGTSGGSVQGFDTLPLYGSTVSYAAKDTRPAKATTVGGAYANAGAALANVVSALIISWYEWGSDTVANSATNPDYLIALSALSGGGSLFIDNGGGTRTDVTPDVAGTKALFTSANCATGWKGKKWAVVGNISGTPHVFTTTNISGGVWSDRGAVSGCSFILVRRRSSFAGQLYWNKTGGIIQYTRDSGVTIVSKSTPLSSVDGVDIWG